MGALAEVGVEGVTPEGGAAKAPEAASRRYAELQRIARARGGIVVSAEYNWRRMIFRCAEGHEWPTAAGVIRKGHWCGRCERGRRTSAPRRAETERALETLVRMAKERNVTILTELATIRTVGQGVEIRCGDCGHEWLRPLEGLVYPRVKSGRHGGWCRECGTKRLWGTRMGARWRRATALGVQALKHIARKRQATILTDLARVRTLKQRVEVQCRVCGHKWSPKVTYLIHHETGCPRCHFGDSWRNSREARYEELQRKVEELGGAVVSSRYDSQRMVFRCADGHEWPAAPGAIRNGGWCARCRPLLGEQVCREAFEAIRPGHLFPKARPPWLVNPTTGRVLELDGYCSDLAIAFEYQGWRHKTDSRVSSRDATKARLCKAHSVVLVAIEEFADPLDYPRAIERVADAMLGAGITAALPELPFVPKVNHPRRLREVLELVAARGGSTTLGAYISSGAMFEVRCGHGHLFRTNAERLKRGCWCPRERGGRINTARAAERAGIAAARYAELQRIARAKGGIVVTPEYQSQRVIFRCAEGHEWATHPANVRAGTWCNECRRVKQRAAATAAARVAGRGGEMALRPETQVALETLRRFAAARNATILSDLSLVGSSKQRVEVRCGLCGHEWSTRIDNVVRGGRWCRRCGAKRAWAARRPKKPVQIQIPAVVSSCAATAFS